MVVSVPKLLPPSTHKSNPPTVPNLWGLGAFTPSFLNANGSYPLPRVMGVLASSLCNLFKKMNEKPCYTKEGIGPNGVFVLRFLIPPFYLSPMLLGDSALQKRFVRSFLVEYLRFSFRTHELLSISAACNVFSSQLMEMTGRITAVSL